MKKNFMAAPGVCSTVELAAGFDDKSQNVLKIESTGDGFRFNKRASSRKG